MQPDESNPRSGACQAGLHPNGLVRESIPDDGASAVSLFLPDLHVVTHLFQGPRLVAGGIDGHQAIGKRIPFLAVH